MSVIWKDTVPVWNLNSTTAYPIELQQKGKSPLVYIFLSPYTSDELKDVLQKAVSGYKREKRDTEIVREDRTIYTPLCDAHFVKMGNANGTPEQQRAFLDRYPELKPGIVEHTFGALHVDREKSESDTDVDNMLDISADLSGAVKVYQELYDSTTDAVVRVNMTHNHAHPTEAQFRDYQGSRRNKFLRKSSLWTVSENHSALERLYNTVIQSIDGATVDGEPCTAERKALWIAGVPLWHKIWVVDHIFAELIEKNV